MSTKNAAVLIVPVALFLLPAAASGGLTEYAFTATVTSSSLGSPLAKGAKIQGTFGYDTTTSASLSTAILATYQTGNLAFSSGSFQYTGLNSTSTTSIYNNVPGLPFYDKFDLSNQLTAGLLSPSADLSLQKNGPFLSLSAPPFTSTNLPNPLPALSAFDSATLQWKGVAGILSFSATITSVQLLAAPEPSTLAIAACGGFGFLAYGLRCRKRVR